MSARRCSARRQRELRGKNENAVIISPVRCVNTLPIPFVECRVKLTSTPDKRSFSNTLFKRVKKQSHQKALPPRPSDGCRVQNKNASIVSILSFLYGCGTRIRT